MNTIAAPEVQHKSCFSSSSDMYSLGMVYIACFNSGQSVIQVRVELCSDRYSLGMVYIACFNSGQSVIQVRVELCSDMYSLGMVYIACFNSGQSVIQLRVELCSDMYSLGMVYIACFNSGQSVIHIRAQCKYESTAQVDLGFNSKLFRQSCYLEIYVLEDFHPTKSNALL